MHPLLNIELEGIGGPRLFLYGKCFVCFFEFSWETEQLAVVKQSINIFSKSLIVVSLVEMHWKLVTFLYSGSDSIPLFKRNSSCFSFHLEVNVFLIETNGDEVAGGYYADCRTLMILNNQDEVFLLLFT